MAAHYPLDYQQKVALNGTPMNIRVRGTSRENPVVLFLHGGPGVCDRHWVLENQSSLAEVCTMVCWDQRGSGLSYTADQGRETMTLDQVVEDARQLVEYLCKTFYKQKLYVVGHSWGTILGTLLIAKHPEQIAAYMGQGQFADGPRNEQLSYDFVWNEANARGDAKGIAELLEIGAPVNGLYKDGLKGLMKQRDYMTKYGGGQVGESEPMIKSLVMPLLRSPEYGLFKLAPYAKGAFYCLRQLWEDVVTVNFIESVHAVEVPVYITQGRHDMNTPPQLAWEWFDKLAAPKKEWIWFENSAHSPIKEEPEKWGEAVRHMLSA